MNFRFRPHCALLRSGTTRKLSIRVLLPSNLDLGTTIIDDTAANERIYHLPTHDNGSGASGAYWTDPGEVYEFELPIPTNCHAHKTTIMVYDGEVPRPDAIPPISGGPLEGRTIIRTIDADANGG